MQWSEPCSSLLLDGTLFGPFSWPLVKGVLVNGDDRSIREGAITATGLLDFGGERRYLREQAERAARSLLRHIA